MIFQPSVPNWLREEIIKKKAVIASSAPEFSEHPNSMAEEVIDKYMNDDPDSKSIDSSRSTEEDDDEEVSSLPLLFSYTLFPP